MNGYLITWNSLLDWFVYWRDKHRDKEHREHKEHRDKEKHHSSKSSHKDRDRDREKKSNGNGVEQHIKAEPVVVFQEEKDPLDTPDFTFPQLNANANANTNADTFQPNGIRDCFVNMSHISETSSCDYSMSQFRADESAFTIKAEQNDEGSMDAGDGNYGMNESQDDDDDDDVPIAQRKKIKRELSDDDEDDVPLTARKKVKSEKKEKKIKRQQSDDDEDDYDKPKKKKIKKEKVWFFIT